MAQRPLGLVIGQRQVRMGQHAKDRLPVIEKFHRQGVSFLVSHFTPQKWPLSAISPRGY